MIDVTQDCVIVVRNPPTDGAREAGMIVMRLQKPTEMIPNLFAVEFLLAIFHPR